MTTTITRGPEFHAYADQRTWLRVPHAGDVLSNLAFVAVAVWFARDRRRAVARGAWWVCAGVAAIGVGSAVYHLAPSDERLVFDWAPIVVTLALLSATVIYERDARAGRIALVVAPCVALASVAWWYAGGGTRGGDMAPYVATQVAGIVLPTVVALVTPGAVGARWLLAGVAGFAVARVCGAYDRELLDAIAISGHSCKHVAAAAAAACALRALRVETR